MDNNLLTDISSLAERIKDLHNEAVIAYTPLVDDICRREASENEVGLLLDYLLSFAGDERILKLYKRVCRCYYEKYPAAIADYILYYRQEYDPESLIGTEYEYLIHQDVDIESESSM